MPISKIKTSSITADAASVNLNIDANTLFLDVTNNRVGVNTTSPSTALDVNGSLKLSSSTTPFILSNMSGSQNTRFGIQNSTTNGNTRFYLYPNGTGNISAINMWNNSDPSAANYSSFDVGIIGTSDIRFTSSAAGTASYLPMTWWQSGVESIRLDTSNRFIINGAYGNGAFDSTAPGIYFNRQSNTAETNVPFIRSVTEGVTTSLQLGPSSTSGALQFWAGGNERARIDSNGNLKFTQHMIRSYINSGTLSEFTIESVSQVNGGYIKILNDGAVGGVRGVRLGVNGNGSTPDSGGTDVLILADSGRIGIGQVTPVSKLHVEENGANVVTVRRNTNEGSMVGFNYAGTDFGAIYTNSGRIALINTRNAVSSGVDMEGDNKAFRPCTGTGGNSDNTHTLGRPDVRWSLVYAATGTINTSDVREKQDIEELSAAETRVAVKAKSLLRKYRWISSVQEKGDDARIHFGIIAQDLKQAFEEEGLDPFRYGMFCYDVWWEREEITPAVEAKDAVLDENGNVIEPAVAAQDEIANINSFKEEIEGCVRKDKMGVRYDQLLAFIIAGL